ncbi:MAG: type II secretion system F family protein [Betaproteobacteria bacterium]|nr:type II secretion system F family protein [Betaproteobacteria bacterium]
MRFRARVVEADGRLAQVRVDALDRASAMAQLSRRGTVLWLRGGSWTRLPVLARASNLNIVLFTEELVTLLDAGLTLGEALETLTLSQADEMAAGPIERILDLLRQGQPFSSALAAQGRLFPPLYCASVRSAERTGHLSQALSRYLAYRHQMERLKKDVVAASIYPLLLMGVGLLVIGFLLAYVVPRFATVYENAGRVPPASTRALLEIGGLLTRHGMLLFGLLFATAILLTAGFRRPEVRRILVRPFWRMPGIAEPLRVFVLARFYRSLAMLLEGGIPLVQAMETASPLLAGDLLDGEARTRRALEEGQPVSRAFAAGGLTTPVAERLLRVGERSGQLGAMMESIARFMDEATARRVGWITRLFEPLLMIVIGLSVGLIVVLLYMPIFDLAGAFQ